MATLGEKIKKKKLKTKKISKPSRLFRHIESSEDTCIIWWHSFVVFIHWKGNYYGCEQKKRKRKKAKLKTFHWLNKGEKKRKKEGQVMPSNQSYKSKQPSALYLFFLSCLTKAQVKSLVLYNTHDFLLNRNLKLKLQTANIDSW